eukprot:1161658-Pelagomonas_calceolata.AAC.7
MISLGLPHLAHLQSGQPCMLEFLPHCNQQILSMQVLFLTNVSNSAYPFSAVGVRGVGPEIRPNPCQNGVSGKFPPGSPDQQERPGTYQYLYHTQTLTTHTQTLTMEHILGGLGGWGEDLQNRSSDLNFGRETARNQGPAMGQRIIAPIHAALL